MNCFSRSAVIAALLLCAGSARCELANAIQAVVHDAVVTYLEVNVLMEQTAEVLVRQYRDQPDVLEQKLNEMRAENLDKLVQNQLILRDFKVAGYSLPESVIDDVVQERIRNDYGDRASLTKNLEARGLTFEKFRKQVRDRFIIQQLRLKNINQEIIISPHKIETYYQTHQQEFKVEDQVKLRMIVLNKAKDDGAPSAPKLAEEILRKLNEGAAFTEMATIYSQGSQRAAGGDWGWVEKSVLRKELADVAFGLEKGQHSQVIDTVESCYLMLVEDKRGARLKALAEVRDQIDKNLLVEERSRLERQWVEKLKKKTFVRYFP